MNDTHSPSSYRTPPTHPPGKDRPVLIARPMSRATEVDTDPLGMIVASAIPVSKQGVMPSGPEVETEEADGTPIRPHYPKHRLYVIGGGSLAATFFATWVVDANPTALTLLCVFGGLTVASSLLDYISNRRKPITRKVLSNEHSSFLIVFILKADGSTGTSGRSGREQSIRSN